MIIKLLNWIFIVFFSIFFIGMICLFYFKSNSDHFYELREYFNQNSMFIATNNNLDINKVNVYWSSDFKAGQIIKNGKNTGLIYKEYGPNRFIVLYQKDTIKEFFYGKSNNWNGYEHSIFLYRGENKNIEAKIKIDGINTD